MLIRNHLDEYILALSEINWNMVIIFGTIVIREIMKNWITFKFPLSIARAVTGARSKQAMS